MIDVDFRPGFLNFMEKAIPAEGAGYMVRSVLAVLGGWVAVGVLVVVTDLVLGRMYPQSYVAGKIPPDSLSALSLATSILYSIAGGWLTALIASRRKWTHVLALVAWGLLMGIASAIFTWGQTQHWYQIGLILGWIPAVLLGGYIKIGGRHQS
jgi:hypothetical protein